MRAHERRAAAGPSTGPRIIVQYRQKTAKVYELESDGGALEVRISQVDQQVDRQLDQQLDEAALSNGWRVDARARLEESVPVGAWGTTAAEALGQVARAWNAHLPALRTFDWDAIARVLHVVQAI